jgi:hypothetical protein
LPSQTDDISGDLEATRIAEFIGGLLALARIPVLGRIVTAGQESE